MIRFLSHTEIDRERWDECISSSPQGLSYALSWYLDIVSPGWDALIEEGYSSVFPLTLRKKAGIHYLYQPYFTQQLGLFSKEVLVPEDKLKEFLAAIPSKYKLIEIQLNTSNVIGNADDFRVVHKLTHHLSLSASYDEIKSGYSENLSRNIKKAIQSGLKITGKVPFTDIISSFRENRGKEITNLKNRDYSTFETLMGVLEKKGMADTPGVINPEGKVIAGAIFLHSQHSHIFLFSALDDEARNKGAMAFLIDAFIRNHANENKILDFEGSMNVNLARFYKSFGSKEVVYLQILKNNLPPVIRWLK